MARFPEPCNCGAPDCPRCYPLDWKRNLMYSLWESLDIETPFEDWLKQEKEKEIEECGTGFWWD